MVIGLNVSGASPQFQPPARAPPATLGSMRRTLTIALLAGLVALLGAAVMAIVKMRASRDIQAAVDQGKELSGSFDTWPEVPLKRGA